MQSKKMNQKKYYFQQITSIVHDSTLLINYLIIEIQNHDSTHHAHNILNITLF